MHATSFRPVDLPEVRAEVLHFHLSHGPGFFDACIRNGMMPLRPAGPIHDAAQYLSKAEAHRVLKGELFWVDAHMTQLAMSAAESLPEFTLMPEDLPAPYGFMVFEKPVYVYRAPDDPRTTHNVAAAWGPFNHPKLPHGGVWVSWYSDRDLNIGPANDGLVSEADRELARQALPRLSYDLEDVYPFSRKPLPSLNPATGEPSKPFGEQQYEKGELLRVIWLLMQQPLAEETEVEPDRAARKRLRRAGQEPKPIRVIALRRPKHNGSDHGDTGREYQHQWIVRGHWRQQWHPKRQVHRPVWIAPHIKGPEGAPLIGGEKVYALKR